jgi:hypothetical protein
MVSWGFLLPYISSAVTTHPTMPLHTKFARAEVDAPRELKAAPGRGEANAKANAETTTKMKWKTETEREAETRQKTDEEACPKHFRTFQPSHTRLLGRTTPVCRISTISKPGFTVSLRWQQSFPEIGSSVS